MSPSCNRILVVVAVVSWVAGSREVGADSIQSSYTLTVLGTGNNAAAPGLPVPNLVKDANGNQVVLASDGQTAYPFPQTFAGTSLSPSAVSSLPLAQPAPPSGGGYQGWSRTYSADVYPNGTVLGLDYSGVYTDGRFTLFTLHANPNGTWGQPTVLLQGPSWPTLAGFDNGPGVGYELSKSGTLLESTNRTLGGPGAHWDYQITNIDNPTQALNLANLPVLLNNGYNLSATNYAYGAIDDQGRILLTANHYSNINDPNSYDGESVLLLTPAGVSLDPLVMNAPEPGSLAVMALAAAGFAAIRIRGRRRRPGK